MRSVQRTHHRQTGIARSRRLPSPQRAQYRRRSRQQSSVLRYHRRQARLSCRFRLRPRPGQPAPACADGWPPRRYADRRKQAWTAPTAGLAREVRFRNARRSRGPRKPRGRHPDSTCWRTRRTYGRVRPRAARRNHRWSTGCLQRFWCSMLWGLADLHTSAWQPARGPARSARDGGSVGRSRRRR